MPKKIFISGSAYSGKSSLIYLFEGHSKILSNVIHFKIVDALNKIDNTFNWIEYDKKKDNLNELIFFFKKNRLITKISKKIMKSYLT